MKLFLSFFVFVATLSLTSYPASAARDASFLSPGASLVKGSQEAVGIEPKSDIELGETPLNTGRRTTVFFVNLSSMPVEITSILATGDANVRAEIVADDCTTQGNIAVGSRCSVSVEATPLSPGFWAAELVMTHKGAGRLARAKISGKTGGSASMEKRELGLEMSVKDIKPVDFGEVDATGDKAVRTALMINDSNENVKILSIEVIAAENGLKRLDQGCLIDAELKPGESCPVTLVWTPENRGAISTDLILRHTGKRGFTVIPVRGKAEGAGRTGSSGGSSSVVLSSAEGIGAGSRSIPLSPTADEVEGLIAQSGSVAPLSSDDLKAKGGGGNDAVLKAVRLIGTVGNRAIFYADGVTFTSQADEEITVRDKTVHVVKVSPRQAVIRHGEKQRMLSLEAAPSLTEKASKSGGTQNDSPTETSFGLQDKQKDDDFRKKSIVPLPGQQVKK